MNQVILSDTNRLPIVQIITYFTLVTSLLAFLTHAGIKLYVFRSLRIESWFVLAALVSSICELDRRDADDFAPGILHCAVYSCHSTNKVWLWHADELTEPE